MKSVVWIIFLFIALNAASQKRVSMNHYTASDGLSSNIVRCIFQDSRGFIWAGTEGGGLNKFDGYRFTIYDYRSDNPHSLSNSQVYAMAEDQDGNIWVGTHNGLNKLDVKTGRFQRFFNDPLQANSLKSNRVSALYVDKDNVLWIGTFLGLQKLDIQKNRFTDYSDKMTNQDGRPEKTVNTIVEDSKGNLWLGVWWGGLKKFSKATGVFTDYYADPKNPDGLLNNNVLSLCIDRSDNLWIGNHTGGLRKFSILTGQFLPLKKPEKNVSIWGICTDGEGRICYTRAGIGFVNTTTNQFETRDYSKDEPEGISSGYHYAVFTDRAGMLWLGSTEGLSFYSPLNKRFASYLKLIDNKKRYYITTFYKRPEKQEIWFGTFGNGIIRLNENTGKTLRIYYGNNDDQSLPDNFITHIKGDSKGRIWIASGNGITIVDENTGKTISTYYHNPQKPSASNAVLGNNDFMFLENDSIRIFDVIHNKEYSFPASGPTALPGRAVTSVFRDNDSSILIGTNAGLVQFNENTKTRAVFGNSCHSISGEAIRSIYRDYKGLLWVGTQNGLNRMDPVSKCFVRTADDISSHSINIIAEDANENLWLLSEKGLTKYNPANNSYRHYDENDGLNAVTCLYKTDNGIFYSNRNREGYYRFNPDSILDNMQKSPVYITRFFLFNKEVPVSSENNETPLKTDILNAQEIVLKYNQSVISFEFTALNYLTTAKNEFYYKLEGFDHDWYRTDALHRLATYTNLSAGNYIFRVKAANSDGIWSENTAELRIKILPPPWKTWWAYLIYGSLIVGTLAYFRNNLIQREKLKNQLKMEALEYERKIKMDEMKMRFFANISHEFRTPLTLILAPLHAILQRAAQHSDQQISEHAGLIQRNAGRLSDLINQLLDLQKLESNSLKPEICEGNIQTFIQAIGNQFSPLAEQKNIRFLIASESDEIMGWFDPDKTEKIITNLLSNAFKFTKNAVSLTMKQEHDRLCIKVEDNGKGIPSEHIGRIFERFYHVDDASQRIQEGTGIGLALVKEMTTLLNGSIHVASEVGRFTCFTLHLPLNRDSFTHYAIRNIPSAPNGSYIRIDTAPAVVNTDEMTSGGDNPLILIVEDNSDLRHFLTLVLSPFYKVVEAANGKDGLKKAYEFIPDLIISDIIMPEMDGVEMVQVLKNELSTSHIPIILLTSLSSADNKLKGLAIGADDYITKPFNEDILLLKISNIIRQRNRLQHFFASKYGLRSEREFQLKDPVVERMDEVFIEKMASIIEAHIDHPEFTNESLAEKLGLSVAVLYRKTNALINCTPADFIRDLKVKRAIQLLKTGTLKVSEVAAQVGFDDPHYFSKWFKKNVGRTPSEILPV